MGGNREANLRFLFQKASEISPLGREIDLVERLDGGELPAAEVAARLASGVLHPVFGRPDNPFDLGQQSLRPFGEGRPDEVLPDIFDRLRRGVNQVVGVEAVVAQVVREDFVGGEIG